ncbi:Beta-galactosidase [Paenibacillus auburnensis]|uniref:Beta-galactosidase n=1 Tax=Paenibacillus auburnensis TaxID=2905649 RepID=A0ABN8H3N1_9BACL|nr:glycoside hydrolase family 2 TIM barrel-domain containing protein [Paenibacillus auburnensis]CAH1221766.1 Beta-galactosidase [Paenibacillus auburnensis]
MAELGRTTILLDKPWGFQLDPEAAGFTMEWPANGLPSSETVSIPHTWNVQPETEHYRGLGWYEHRFQAPEIPPDGRVWLHFEAVYHDAVIWINGQQAGSHLNSGYTAFRVEVTRYVKPGEENLLVVSVDNGNSETALPKGNSFDWADDGGIIRDVTMILTGEAAIDSIGVEAVPIFSPDGQSAVTGKITGEVTLHEALQPRSREVSLEFILQYKGTTVWTGTQKASYPCNAIPFPEITVDGIEPWHFDRPNLYELHVHLSAGGQMQDEVTIAIGFREFKAEGSRFLLNGEPVRLTGVEWMPGSHPYTGMAESEEDIKRVLKQLKLANGVLTRFHWQQSDKLLEWCDRYGILVQEEIPLWQQPAEPGEATIPLVRQQLSEMISRHRHHPSVIAWGVGNELDGQSAQTVRYVKEMKAYIQPLDSSRMVNYVSNTVHLDPFADATGAGDVIMWNDYIGTWHGEHDMEETVQKLVAAYPDKPIVVAEFGLCEPAYSGGDARRREQMLEKMDVYRKYPNIAGMIYFSLNDYRTQMGEDGEGRLRQRVHGVTDLYGVEKESYQILKDVSSPVKLEVLNSEDGDEPICRLTCSNHLPSYSISGYKLHLAEETGGWEQCFDIPELLPGEHADISVPALGLAQRMKAIVRRPNGFKVLEHWFELR